MNDYIGYLAQKWVDARREFAELDTVANTFDQPPCYKLAMKRMDKAQRDLMRELERFALEFEKQRLE